MSYKKNIIERIRIYKKIISSLKTHVSTLELNIRNIYDSLDLVNKYYSNTNKLISKLNTKLSTRIKLETYFEIYDIISNIDHNLKEMIKLTRINKDNVVSNMSDTFLIEIMKQHDKINSSWNVLMAKLNHWDITHIFGEAIQNEKLEKVEFLYNSHPFSLDLYCHYIQLNLISKEEQPEYEKYLFAIEKIKQGLFNKKILGSKMQLFNLIPVFQDITLSNVISKALNIEHDTTDIKHLSSLLSEKNKGLILFYEMIDLPVKYNLRGMTDKKAILDFNIDPNSGIDYNILKKYKTIILGEKNKPNISTKLLGNTKSDSWLILRTLDGIKFDILANNRRKLYFPKHFIEKLQRPSSRIYMYQKQKNKKLLNFIKTPQEIVLNEKYDEANAISGLLKILFEAYAEKQLQKKIPKTILEFHTLFSPRDIKNIISQVLVESLLDYEHKNIELTTTFINIIEDLSQKTIREINEGFAKSSINEDIFSNYTSSALVTIIRKELFDIVNLSISKNFGDNIDFYEMLFIKRALLNVNFLNII